MTCCGNGITMRGPSSYHCHHIIIASAWHMTGPSSYHCHRLIIASAWQDDGAIILSLPSSYHCMGMTRWGGHHLIIASSSYHCHHLIIVSSSYHCHHLIIALAWHDEGAIILSLPSRAALPWRAKYNHWRARDYADHLIIVRGRPLWGSKGGREGGNREGWNEEVKRKSFHYNVIYIWNTLAFPMLMLILFYLSFRRLHEYVRMVFLP